MKLIVALGNPGTQYTVTRHNAGWQIIDAWLATQTNVTTKQEFKGETYTLNLNGEKIIVLKPQTFMNLSGQSLIMCMQFYKLALTDILVFHDDKDFAFGRTAIKFAGSPAGHNGLKNIIALTGSDQFARYRIGIGHPAPEYKIVDWVLSKMNSEELAVLHTKVTEVNNIINDFSKGESFTTLMAKYNKQ